MEVQLLTPAEWTTYRTKLTAYTLKYGERRITSDSLKRLASLPAAQLAPPGLPGGGAAVAVAREGGKLLGVAVAFNHEQCIVVAHPKARGRGIGSLLLRTLQDRLGKLRCSVAGDNIASIAMCIKAGMAATRVVPGPTGKPTLEFEGCGRAPGEKQQTGRN